MRCWILEETRVWRGFGQTSLHSISLPAICQTTGICLQLIRIGSLYIMHVWEGTELDLMQNKADPVCQAENGCSCILWRHRAVTLSQTTWTFTQADDSRLCLSGKVNFAGCLCKVPSLTSWSISGAQTAKILKKKNNPSLHLKGLNEVEPPPGSCWLTNTLWQDWKSWKKYKEITWCFSLH